MCMDLASRNPRWTLSQNFMLRKFFACPHLFTVFKFHTFSAHIRTCWFFFSIFVIFTQNVVHFENYIHVKLTKHEKLTVRGNFGAIIEENESTIHVESGVTWRPTTCTFTSMSWYNNIHQFSVNNSRTSNALCRKYGATVQFRLEMRRMQFLKSPHSKCRD